MSGRSTLLTERATERTTEQATERVTERSTERLSDPLSNPLSERFPEPVTAPSGEPAREPARGAVAETGTGGLPEPALPALQLPLLPIEALPKGDRPDEGPPLPFPAEDVPGEDPLYPELLTPELQSLELQSLELKTPGLAGELGNTAVVEAENRSLAPNLEALPPGVVAEGAASPFNPLACLGPPHWRLEDDRAVLYQGNCLDFLSKLPENSIDVIFADPPYKLSNDGFTCQSGRAVSVNKGDWDRSDGLGEDFIFHVEWMRACHQVLKPNGTIWISGTYHNIFACGFALQTVGFHLLNDICWFKPNASPNLSCRVFTASHETLLWARKSKKGKHTFNYQAMKEGDFRRDRLKTPGRQMRTVWSIPTPPFVEKRHGKHPTQKPLALLDRIIAASTQPGDWVLDPFVGSGTTGIAALQHGCQFIGMDTNPDYLKLSSDRLQAVCKETTSDEIKSDAH